MPSNCTPEGNVAGHAWLQIPATRRPKYGGVLIVWRCDRCGTERDDIVNRFTGELMDRHYRYALVKPTKGLDMANKRLTLIQEIRRTRRHAG